MKKSLSEDTVDFYSHTWAFLLFLFLSLVCLFVSYHPAMTVQTSQVPYKFPVGKNENQKMDHPRYTASCWTPVEFTRAMVLYSEAICASVLNAFVEDKTPPGTASLHAPLPEAPPPRASDSDELTREAFLQLTDNDTGVDAGASKDKTLLEQGEKLRESITLLQHEESKTHTRLQELISYETPVLLFLLAVCLKIPYLIWSVLSICCGCTNVDQFLEMAQKTDSQDGRSQQRTRRQNSGNSTGYLYLAMKVLMIIVVVCHTFVISHTLYDEAQKLDGDLAIVKNLEADVQKHLESMSNLQTDGNSQGDTLDTSGSQKSQSYRLPSHALYICSFSIRQLMNIQRFAIQCVFKQTQTPQQPQPETDRGVVKEKSFSDQSKKILLLYKALFTVVLATLVVLVVFNFFSLVGWLSKLMLSSCRRSLGLKPEATVDEVFLISMAWHNTSAVVATSLAKNSTWYQNSGDDQEDFDKLRGGAGDC